MATRITESQLRRIIREEITASRRPRLHESMYADTVDRFKSDYKKAGGNPDKIDHQTWSVVGNFFTRESEFRDAFKDIAAEAGKEKFEKIVRMWQDAYDMAWG